MDACLDLLEAAVEVYPESASQRCVVDLYRKVFSHAPHTKVREVAAMLRAIYALENKNAAQQKSDQVIEKSKTMKLPAAAQLLENSIDETLNCYDFPSSYWFKLITVYPLERLLKKARCRTRVVGAFPDGHSALMLFAANIHHVSAIT